MQALAPDLTAVSAPASPRSPICVVRYNRRSPSTDLPHRRSPAVRPARRCKRLQVDEIWSFIHCKQRNVAEAKAAPSQAGDIWTWTAIDADTKLIPSWLVGSRDGDAAKVFISDLADRLTNRVQLTSDGHRAYLEAVEEAFGAAPWPGLPRRSRVRR